MAKKVFIVAGDASGDVYGAQLIKSLRAIEPDVKIAGLGGDHMAATEMTFLYNLVKEFSVMGFIPVVLGMPKVMRFLEITLDYIDREVPDVVVLIDYPGFNLYLATHTKTRNIATIFYVTPQIWAWASWRVKKIKRLIAKMLVIFPFEVPFYEKANVPVEYVGHPLLDRMALFQINCNFCEQNDVDQDMLAILPGSRKAEIKANLPAMLWVAAQMAQQVTIKTVCIALASNKYQTLATTIWQNHKHLALPEIRLIIGSTYDVIHHAHMALVTSGTATLETAMLNKPMVVMYKIPLFHKWVVENTSFLKCKYFALPNIINDKRIVPEHLICTTTPKNALVEALLLWNPTSEREKCVQGLTKTRQLLERPGASARAAKAIIDYIK